MTDGRKTDDRSLPEDVFDLAQQRATLGTVFYLGQAFEFLQQLALAFVQLAGSLHPYFDKQITFTMSAEYGNSLAADTKCRT